MFSIEPSGIGTFAFVGAATSTKLQNLLLHVIFDPEAMQQVGNVAATECWHFGHLVHFSI